MMEMFLLVAFLTCVNALVLFMHFSQRARLKQFQEALNDLKHENKTLYRADARFGEVLTQLSRKIEMVSEDFRHLTERKMGQEVYDNALRLVDSGSDIDTVVEKSGLTKGEVELLLTLKKTHTQLDRIV